MSRSPLAPRRRALLLSLAAASFALPLRAQSPSRFDGRWRAVDEADRGNRLVIAGRQVSILGPAGAKGVEFPPARLTGNRLELEGPAGSGVVVVLTLAADNRLIVRVPGEAPKEMVRDDSPPARPVPPAPAVDNTPVATGAVDPVRGRYVAEGQAGGGMEFGQGVVRFLDGSQPLPALPYQQQGARLTIYGPHMNETLFVLQDGRLRLSREGTRPVHFRKSGP